MDSNLINLTNISDAKISISQNVFDKKFELLGLSAAIITVGSFEEQESATQALNAISKLLKDVEAARKTVKSPVFELGRKIDELAKNFSGELESEKNRISRLIGSYVAEQERQRLAEERRLREEAERKRREEEEAQRKAQETNKRSADYGACEGFNQASWRTQGKADVLAQALGGLRAVLSPKRGAAARLYSTH